MMVQRSFSGLFGLSIDSDEEGTAVIRLRARGMGSPPARGAAAVLLTACLVACGCGQDAGPDGTTPQDPSSMTEEDYIAHVAALTVAVEEGLSGEEADRRAVELGSRGYSREQIEQFAARLSSRPHRWVEIEKEIDARAAELRSGASGQADTPNLFQEQS